MLKRWRLAGLSSGKKSRSTEDLNVNDTFNVDSSFATLPILEVTRVSTMASEEGNLLKTVKTSEEDICPEDNVEQNAANSTIVPYLTPQPGNNFSSTTYTAVDPSNTAILDVKESNLMPYGDGSNKIFGYENFGNTCYCNSILQCFFNHSVFRTSMLSFPSSNSDGERARTLETFGRSKRNINGVSKESRSSSNSQNEILEDATKYKAQEKLAHGKKFIAGLLKRHSSSAENVNYRGAETIAKSSESSLNIDDLYINDMPGDKILPKLSSFDDENVLNKTKKYDGLIVGRPVSQGRKDSSSSVLSTNEISNESSASEIDMDYNSEYLSSEKRKRNALLKGPVLDIDSIVNKKQDSSLYYALKDIFECAVETNFLSGVISPVQFIDTLKKENVLFDTTMHQDAHEFLNFLMNNLSDYIWANNKKGDLKIDNFVQDIFQGSLTNQIRCYTCDSITSTEEPFLDFAIEVKEDENLNIQRHLESFHQRELLNGSDKFYCDRCCGLQEAERLVGLKRLPKTLSLHLKRFKYSEDKMANIKLFNKIDYPTFLTVSSTFDSKLSKRYELASAVIHLGDGPQYGHYISLCKTETFGWLLFDDETVEAVDEQTVLSFTGENSDTAYVLFYNEVSEYDEVKSSTQAYEEYNTHIDQLIRHDDCLHHLHDEPHDKPINDSFKTSTASSINPEKNDSSSKIGRRKSRLLNFMKK
ncbi:hypothetical protein KAFR_0L01730 [Kazachstania africana CBS 2517]|uniref:ubiquitinyl hydrolase 1 n=1 Tax=Kazachstania africana (strain ATCC 22294 / BCRC 22015 / CBS 2517 / CECT 1963 / NBRC 1671 / NRRL Y-8276) TaxID=1071382 RepID=H2B2D3_KAZAF|nr:hypothetical protein KAFR_0L01730 [Kazachstania africana CBS 2517]CCF60783.1 hypothetical protein KAFR_0L01730 [Kazachstania africana CBS 2517]